MRLRLGKSYKHSENGSIYRKQVHYENEIKARKILQAFGEQLDLQKAGSLRK
jgi:hypothetical protein